jgi:hypothetical protein
MFANTTGCHIYFKSVLVFITCDAKLAVIACGRQSALKISWHDTVPAP